MTQVNFYTISGTMLFFSFLLLSGCDRTQKTEERTKEEISPPSAIAQVADGMITRTEFLAYLKSRASASRMPAGDEQDIDKHLQELITSEMFFQEAKRLSLDQDPGYRRTIRQMLNQTLLKSQVEQKILEQEITEEEVQGYYQKHIEIYSRPEMIRLADIFFPIPNNASTTKRDEIRQRGETVFSEIREVKKNRFWFTEFVKKYSATHPQYPLGDTGYFSKKGALAGYDPEFVTLAFTLTESGTVHNKLLETPAGFHIVMLVSRRPLFHREVTEVTTEIKRKIRHEQLALAKEEYIKNLKTKTRIEINDTILAEVKERIGNEMRQKSSLKAENEQRHRIAPPSFPAR